MIYSLTSKENINGVSHGRFIKGFPAGSAILSLIKVDPALHNALLKAGGVRFGTTRAFASATGITRYVGRRGYKETHVNYYTVPWSLIPEDLRDDISIRWVFHNATFDAEKSKALNVVRRIRDIIGIAGIKTYRFGRLDNGRSYCLFTPTEDTEETRKRLSLQDWTKLASVDVRDGQVISMKTGFERDIVFAEPSPLGPYFLLFLEGENEEDYLKSLIPEFAFEHDVLVETFIPLSNYSVDRYPPWARIAATAKARMEQCGNNIFVEEETPYNRDAYGSKTDIVRVFATEAYSGPDGFIVQMNDAEALRMLEAIPLKVVKGKRIEKGAVFDTNVLDYALNGAPGSGYYLVQDLSDEELDILNREYKIPELPHQLNKLTFLDFIHSMHKDLKYPDLPDERKALHKRLRSNLDMGEYHLVSA